MTCSKCSSNFDDESITIMRKECNYTVIQVKCSCCGKNIGIAILGLDENEIKKSLGAEEQGSELTVGEVCPIIGYDDVIDAHNFFRTLGNDWCRHIPTQKTEQ